LQLDGVDVDVLRNMIVGTPSREGELGVAEDSQTGDFNGMSFVSNGNEIAVAGGKADVSGISGEISLQGYQYGSAIPDSVVHQFVAENFSSPWPDEAGSGDMTVNGLTASTFSNGEDSVAGDGSSDHGLASGPNSLPENEAFGVAFTIEGTDKTDLTEFWGVNDGGNRFTLFQDDASGSLGQPVLSLNDGSDGLKIEAKVDILDGDVHLVVINKAGDSAADVDFYIDDMSSPVSQNNRIDQAFDHTNYSVSEDMGFFAENAGGSVDGHIEYDTGIFEFRDETYSEDDRNELKDSRPEV